MQRMVEFAPSSGGLALWVGHADLPATDGAGAAEPAAPLLTDGRTLWYAPAFDALPLEEQTACVAHAVLHVALRHVPRAQALRQRLGEVDAALFNLCADAIVNSALAHLRWLRLPAGAVTLEQVLSQVLNVETPAEQALLEWDVERLYHAVDDRRTAQEAPRRPLLRWPLGRRAAAARGLEYIAITDHGQRVTMAHGLDRRRLLRQWDEIDALNESLAADGKPPIVVLKGIEVDMLEKGGLDLPEGLTVEQSASLRIR